MIKKNGAGFCPELMKKTIFKISAILSGNAFIKYSRKISNSTNIRRIIVFFLFPASCKSHVNSNMVRKLVKENILAKNYGLTFFIWKLMSDLNATLKCCCNILYRYRQNNFVIICLPKNVLFTPKKTKNNNPKQKRTNENVAFIYVLSVIIACTYTPYMFFKR